jgi:hypothetical protein
VGLEEGGVESQAAWRLLHGGDGVFSDPLARLFDDEDHAIEERREIIIGHSTRHRLLLVSFAQREDVIRLISARKATRNERKDYEEGTEP